MSGYVVLVGARDSGRSLNMVCIAAALLVLSTTCVGIAAETRGIRLEARDAVTGQLGEVVLYRKTFAVIVGVDRYQGLPPDRQLQNAVRDARGVEGVLKKKFRFDKIIVLENEQASKERVMRLLTTELPKEMGKDDALFFFWAGHGNQEKSEYGDIGYLIPYDGSAEEIYRNITMSELRDTVSKKIPAKHVFYVMDACYSGLLTTRSVDSKPRRDLEYLKEITRESVRQVLTAGGKGEEALDGGPKGHSVFTGRLIELLENAVDYVTANELQASIRERVCSDAVARNHRQTPSFGVLHGMGDFVFIPRKQDRLADLSASSAARQKELERLMRVDAEAKAAKEHEQAEVSKKEADLAALDKQISDMKARLSNSLAEDDSLDQLVALAEQKEKLGKNLETLRRQRQEEEQKRQQELYRLEEEALKKRKAKIEKDLEKYRKIISSKYAQDIKPTAWNALVSNYPEAKGITRYDEEGFRTAVGLSGGQGGGDGILLKAKNGNVIFNHISHKMVPKDCKACHEHSPPGKIIVPSWRDFGHQTCKKCHTDLNIGPTKCGECHKKESTASTKQEPKVAKDKLLVLAKGQASANRFFFVDNSDVIDTQAGLMWVRDVGTSGWGTTWKVANDVVTNLERGGYRDWRLPTKEELLTLSKRIAEHSGQDVNFVGFKNDQNWYWSSNIKSGYLGGAEIVRIKDGQVGFDNFGSTNCILAVRDI